MKKIQFKKPDIKGTFQKLKNLKWADVKAYRKMRQERAEKRREERRNSEFGKKLQRIFQYMNKISLLLHAVWAIVINFIIEAVSRHSVFAAIEYLTETPLVFFYNAFMIFVTFSIVYFFKRRAFMRIILSVIWIFIGIVNGVMLSKRVTPFNAQDLKTFTEGLSLFTNYFTVVELVLMAIAVPVVILIIISLWKNVGKYEGKVNKIVAVVLLVLSFGSYTVITNLAIENRVVSTYFGNIAFAYQDYGFPYCFAASLFNTGISEPNGYTEEMIAEISNDSALTESTSETDVLPNVLVVQLESYFDTSEFEALQTSEDPLPYLRQLSEEYSSGYFKVPSVGAGTANTEFEVLTGMNLRYFGPGEYPYKTYLKNYTAESAATAFASFGPDFR